MSSSPFTSATRSRMSHTETVTVNGAPISSPQPPFGKAAAAAQATQQAPSELLPHAPHYAIRRSLPNTPLAVSVIAASLGALAAGSLAFAAQPLLRSLGSATWTWARPQLGLYFVAMGMFHLWEFWTTAGWNPAKLSVDGECSELYILRTGCHVSTRMELSGSLPPEQWKAVSHRPRRRACRVLHLVLVLPTEVQFDPQLAGVPRFRCVTI